ncbi:unnamed protein product [Caenorhabditis bovis]|uniref:Uncharacterized protein n=1 Tax=Caenorhabditis bovis TaxID=2654633 RepID=A0A8S1F633_9PELO|nr:unnamed protein product [Caenorhabditis bovis]
MFKYIWENDVNDHYFKPPPFDEENAIKNLYKNQVLKGHEGCVNTLKWNKSGTLLASGSDDRHIIIWRGTGEQVHNIRTNHMGNIFAVDFMPQRPQLLVSGAADHTILTNHILYGNEGFWQTDGRVKRIITLEEDPFLLWAAVEDGTVKRVDIRSNEMSTFITVEDKDYAVKTIANTEILPYLIAVGFDVAETHIYDRRNTTKPAIILRPSDPSIQYAHSTHVTFNSAGTHVLVNLGGVGAYLYDLKEGNEPNILNSIYDLIKTPEVQDPIIRHTELEHQDIRNKGNNLIRAKKFSEAIDYYSRLMEQKFKDNALNSVMASNRALGFLLRRQKGDSYSCVRDSIKALELHNGNAKALYRLANGLICVDQFSLAGKVCDEFRRRFPNDKSIEKLESQVTDMNRKGHSRSMEIGNDEIDYISRYHAHLNDQTDIKEANFFGTDDRFIVAGSDCGTMFVYDTKSTALIGAWQADENILNILQPHPSMFMLATSGIDYDIKLWEPRFEKTEEETQNDSKMPDPYEFMERRQRNGLEFTFMSRRVLRAQPECVTS